MSIESNKQLKQYYNERIQGLSERTPVCAHFNECGGCSWQHLHYETQIDLKSKALQEIMSDVVAVTTRVIASPAEFNYRARMDYVCAHDPFHPPVDRMGLRKRKQFRHVIDLQECHLIPPQLFQQIRKMYSYACTLDLPLYDLVSGKGELRYLVVRTAGDRSLLNIITKSIAVGDAVEKLAQRALQNGISTVYWLEQPELSDVSFGKIARFWGEEFLAVKIGQRIELQIGPNTFFQNNIPQFEQLIHYVSAKLEPAPLLLDLYCGVGTIGLMLADKFTRVIGVELNAESVELARLNCVRNQIENVRFFAGDVAGINSMVSDHDLQAASVIVDPPRAGLTTKGVTSVMDLSPEQIIYISCNPITQAQDLKQFVTNYEVTFLQGFDMFPQTPHLESVAILKRREL